jgi:ATP-dependent DNA helicase RecG
MISDLSSRLADMAFLDARTQKALASGGFVTAGQLLQHFPFRWEDRRQFSDWPHAASPEAMCLHGTVTDAQLKRMGYKRSFVEIKIEREDTAGLTEPVVLRFFSGSWLIKQFAAGMEVVAFGKVKRASGKRLVMDQPEYEIVGDDADDVRIHLRRIVPVYRAREGVPQKQLRRAVFLLLENLADAACEDVLPPPSDAGDFAGLSRARALRRIHFPESMEQMEGARRYLALEEFFTL